MRKKYHLILHVLEMLLNFFLKNKVYPYKRWKKWIKLFKFKCIKKSSFLEKNKRENKW